MNSILQLPPQKFSPRQLKELRWMQKRKKPLRLVSFFGGQGNADLSAQQAGFETLVMFDWDKHKCKTFALNFPATKILQIDLFTTSAEEVLAILESMGIQRGTFGCMFAPPCPGLSHDGPKDPWDYRNKLLVEVVPKLISTLNPQFYICEEVKALVEGRNKKIYWVFRNRLNAIDNYVWDYRIMNAIHYSGVDGVPAPQARNRIAIAGIRNDISNTIDFPIANTSNKEKCFVENVAPQITKIYSGRKFTEQKAKYSNTIMPTIMATPNIKVDDIDGNKKRWLNEAELKIFFGVPQSFKTTGSFAKKWRGFGDAICVPMFYQIFKLIREKYLDPFNDDGNQHSVIPPSVTPDTAGELISAKSEIVAPANLEPPIADISTPAVITVPDARVVTPAVNIAVFQKDVTILGDCLKVMPQFPDHSFDMILTDPPYGITDHEWDKVIPFDRLWAEYKRLIKPNGVIVLFAQQPFTTDLINSNRKMFRYSIIWQKNAATGHLNANVQPLRIHEDLLIFYKKKPHYTPQKIIVSKVPGYAPNDRYPTSVWKFPKDAQRLHPTQKPLALVQKLIETYTRPGELVLDSCAGCGTTGLAAKLSGRHYVQIESDKKYHTMAVNRTN